MADLRIAIASDIHADSQPGRDSHVVMEPHSAMSDPIEDLFDFVRARGIRTDYLIAPGDLTNKADTTAFSYAWQRLHSLADALGASLIAAPGNHDLVTRSAVPDPAAHLRYLMPSFPTGDASLDDSFWRDGFTIIENEDHRILVLNSCADFPPFPVGAVDPSPEWTEYLEALNRGGFPVEVEAKLKSALMGLERKLNIAVLHHHPQEHQLKEKFRDSYGPMRRGDQLLAVLNDHPGMGRWFIVHGHKHIPQLVHAGGALADNLVLFCAASLGAELWSPISTVTRNQFHVVSITDRPEAGLGTLRGVVESYFWGYGIGWMEPQRRGCGLPAVGGFGCMDDFRDLALQVAELMDGKEFLPYEAVVAGIRRLPFQTPTQFDALEEQLQSLGLELMRDSKERVSQVLRRR